MEEEELKRKLDKCRCLDDERHFFHNFRIHFQMPLFFSFFSALKKCWKEKLALVFTSRHFTSSDSRTEQKRASRSAAAHLILLDFLSEVLVLLLALLLLLFSQVLLLLEFLLQL